jgi:hypothetical protein
MSCVLQRVSVVAVLQLRYILYKKQYRTGCYGVQDVSMLLCFDRILTSYSIQRRAAYFDVTRGIHGVSCIEGSGEPVGGLM